MEEEMNYLEFSFVIQPAQPASEILIAELGQAGFESFVENEDGITAYIRKQDFRAGILEDIQVLDSEEFHISYAQKEIEQVNWNSEWEKNFHPIVVNDECGVRAPFHPKAQVKYDIVIEPKMSFGTGHHATTYMMIEFLLKNDLKEKRVLDMGCGTGVLAILADKKGAAAIDAIDIDSWCFENTTENVERNSCHRINVYQGAAALLTNKKYDTIIANINRNILLEDIRTYAGCLEAGGFLFLSGFLKQDVPEIRKECEKHQLEYNDRLDREDWVALKFYRNH